MLVADIHHVSLNVSDTERALTFYRDILGMALLPRPTSRSAVPGSTPVTEVRSTSSKGTCHPTSGSTWRSRVDDVEAVIARLRQAGVEVSEAKNVGDTTIRQAFGHDPDGNLLEFSQPT